MRTAVSDALLAAAPATAADAALWLHGAALAERHRADPVAGGCGDPGCWAGRRGVCWVRPFAQRLMEASCGSWVQRWTARHDARSCGLPVSEGRAAAGTIEARRA
ncbi:hypothetical protein GCM10009827_101300 [Dactylosporangium maewongense]|uniref:Uncharacterized protein n=1 Tax=Dactylosporangium maewongense TaxID=634393 RepID=A0ABP4NKY8_9ACTN